MSENKLEFKIKKDSANKDVELEGMSLEAAKAFSTILNAMINIIQINDDKEGLKIRIESGSAVLIAQGSSEQIELLENSFKMVVAYKSENKELVREWRSIQDLFLKNGLEYEANFYNNKLKTSVLIPLKAGKKLRAKPASVPIVSSIKFMKGKLISVGGANPNIHLESEQNKRITISCTEISAKKANRFLYEQIFIACWSKSSSNEEKFELCDSYGSEREFEMLRLFLDTFNNTNNEIEQLKMLHYRSRDFLDIKDYGNFRKFLRLFIHESTDVNILKTLLIVTQSFKEHERLKEMREKMKIIFNKKMRIYNRKLR